MDSSVWLQQSLSIVSKNQAVSTKLLSATMTDMYYYMLVIWYGYHHSYHHQQLHFHFASHTQKKNNLVQNPSLQLNFCEGTSTKNFGPAKFTCSAWFKTSPNICKNGPPFFWWKKKQNKFLLFSCSLKQ